MTATVSRRPASAATRPTRAILTVMVLLIFVVAAPLASAGSTSSADPSDVVILIDFSNSIMNPDGDPNLTSTQKQRANQARMDLADTFDRLREHVLTHRSELALGNATISFVSFATKAVEFRRVCTRMHLRSDPKQVLRLADCLGEIAKQYRAGARATIIRAVDSRNTNYLAAMEKADDLLPRSSERPAVIFFTDGKHDVAGGMSAGDAIRRSLDLFSARPRFALLPVGMGLEDDSLRAGLEQLDIVRAMDSCEGQDEFTWPEVVFDGPYVAGDKVADALHKVTCAFPPTVVEPTPTPKPAPPGAPESVSVATGDRSVRISWRRPMTEVPLDRYDLQCRTVGAASWQAYPEIRPDATETTIDGLEAMSEYECQIRAVSTAGISGWAGDTATVAGPPAAPVSITVEARDAGGFAVVVPGPDGGSAITGYEVACQRSGDPSTLQPVETAADGTGIVLASLTNEVPYECAASAVNRYGVGPASVLSAPFTPCGSILQCVPWLTPLLILLLGLLLAALAFWLLRWYANRLRPWITAEVDDLPAELLGRGPIVHMDLIRNARGMVTQVSPSAPGAELSVTYLGGDRFTAGTALGEPVELQDGFPTAIVDGTGSSHRLTVRAYREAPVDDPAFAGDDSASIDAYFTGEGSR